MNFSQLHKQYLVMLVVGGFLLVLLHVVETQIQEMVLPELETLNRCLRRLALSSKYLKQWFQVLPSQHPHKQRFQKQSPIKQTKISHLNLLLVFEMKGSM